MRTLKQIFHLLFEIDSFKLSDNLKIMYPKNVQEYIVEEL